MESGGACHPSESSHWASRLRLLLFRGTEAARRQPHARGPPKLWEVLRPRPRGRRSWKRAGLPMPRKEFARCSQENCGGLTLSDDTSIVKKRSTYNVRPRNWRESARLSPERAQRARRKWLVNG